MTSKSPSSSNPFHHRAITWLRDEMELDTPVLPTNAVADANDPTRAVIDGHVVVGGRRDTSGFLATMMVIVAACVGLVGARPGLGNPLTLALWGTATGLVVTAIALLVVEARRARGARLPVSVLVRSRGGAEVTPDEIERWADGGDTSRWVVSEAGFAPEALAVARDRRVRCFAKGISSFVEVASAAA